MGAQICLMGHLTVVAFCFRVHFLSHDMIELGMMWKRIQLHLYELNIQI